MIASTNSCNVAQFIIPFTSLPAQKPSKASCGSCFTLLLAWQANPGKSGQAWKDLEGFIRFGFTGSMYEMGGGLCTNQEHTIPSTIHNETMKSDWRLASNGLYNGLIWPLSESASVRSVEHVTKFWKAGVTFCHKSSIFLNHFEPQKITKYHQMLQRRKYHQVTNIIRRKWSRKEWY